MFLIIRPIRLALKALLEQSTPGQLAFGFAFGVLIGLIPKGNLLVVTLSVILAASRANIGVAAASVLVVSFISSYFDPVSHSIGHWLLSHPSLQGTWTHLYNMPLMPWTDFYNTIVIGSFALGVMLLYPLYRISKPFFEKYSEKFGNWVKKFWITRVLLGVEWADRLGTSGSV